MVTGMRTGLGLLALASLLAAGPASAQSVALQPAPPQAPAPAAVAPSGAPQPVPDDPDSVMVAELVVVARDHGPAWWSVTSGASTVYVLGAPTLSPKRLGWDTKTLERRLQGVNEVILPYRVKMHIARSLATAWRFLKLRSGTPFERNAEPTLGARFAAAREKIGQPAERYKTKNPLAAGLLLANDYRSYWKLTSSDAEENAKVLAKQAGASIVQPEYDTALILGAVVGAPADAGLTCLEAVLDQVEAGPGATQAAGRAWAQGDTPAALANDRTYERCLFEAPGARAFEARTKTDVIAEIEKALTKPGHSVAVVWLPPLLSQGGVLDQLRAKGYQIKTPGEI
jgi:uncharacterized protein YbaP (TraB family)